MTAFVWVSLPLSLSLQWTPLLPAYNVIIIDPSCVTHVPLMMTRLGGFLLFCGNFSNNAGKKWDAKWPDTLLRLGAVIKYDQKKHLFLKQVLKYSVLYESNCKFWVRAQFLFRFLWTWPLSCCEPSLSLTYDIKPGITFLCFWLIVWKRGIDLSNLLKTHLFFSFD